MGVHVSVAFGTGVPLGTVVALGSPVVRVGAGVPGVPGVAGVVGEAIEVWVEVQGSVGLAVTVLVAVLAGELVGVLGAVWVGVLVVVGPPGAETLEVRRISAKGPATKVPGCSSVRSAIV